MHCLQQSIAQVLDYCYGHHIQRLMVTGLFALLGQTKPTQIHAWYLAMYVEAVEWVELPNVLGMSQYADGGIMAAKPHIATGRYIDKMSNYCDHCRYKPDQAGNRIGLPIHHALLGISRQTPRKIRQAPAFGFAGKAPGCSER